MLSWVVLFCVVLFCVVLFCFVLFCFVLQSFKRSLISEVFGEREQTVVSSSAGVALC